MSYLDGLNFEQKEAVLHTKGPLLILAGAGAGKTKVLTHRIIHIIKSGEAKENILAITFTNKAAKEMRDRVNNLISSEITENLTVFSDLSEIRPFISTFHALGVKIIRENAHHLSLNRHFTIYDKNDSIQAIKESIKKAGYDPKSFEPLKILKVISRKKGDMVTSEEFGVEAVNDFFLNVVSEVWEQYELILRKERALDFDDLLLKTAILLRDHQEILSKYQKKWKYIHIDEYQDTNKVQYEISHLLSKKTRNICVVGDMDQNIYAWRGANIKNIMDFEKDYPDARTVVLEQNYRSTKNILSMANTVIKKNKRRKEKNLFTKNPAGEKISIFGAYDEVEEAHFTAAKSKELWQSGTNPNEIAVLFRANFQSRVMEEAFLSHGVPYQVLGVKFFERKEIKDALSYLKASINRDSLSDIKRIINVPPRGIGKTSILKIFAGRENELSKNIKNNLNDFYNLLDKIKKYGESRKISETLRLIIKESGMERALKTGLEDDAERLENLYELVTLSSRYNHMTPLESVEKLLEEAALATDQDEIKDDKLAVKLMTVHASKGLEFKNVFITGLEQDLFPHQKITSDDISEEESEEERRLFYVALTRAKKKVFLTFAGSRTIFGNKKMNVPSEFFSDLDDDLVETTEEPPIIKEKIKTIYLD